MARNSIFEPFSPFSGGFFPHFHVRPKSIFQKGIEVCYCLSDWGCLAWVPSWARPGPIPGPKGSRPDSPCALFYSISDPSRSRGGAIPARPGPIPRVPSRIGPGRAETDFLATSEFCRHFLRRLFVTCGVFARGFFVALFCLEKQCLGLFRYFFVVFSWLFRGPRFSNFSKFTKISKFSKFTKNFRKQ